MILRIAEPEAAVPERIVPKKKTLCTTECLYINIENTKAAPILMRLKQSIDAKQCHSREDSDEDDGKLPKGCY